MRKLITICLTVAGCALATYFLWTPNAIEEDTHEEEHHEDFLPFSKEVAEANNIEIEKAGPGMLKQKVEAPAQIKIIPDQEAHIHPKISGIVVAACKNLGDPVSAGEVVAILESKEMAEAKASYLTALKKEQLSSTAYEREKKLHEKNISSTQDYNAAENTMEESKIETELCRQKLLSLGLDSDCINHLPNDSCDTLRTYEVRSPITGKIIDRRIASGEFITADEEIYSVADLSTVWAEIHIFANDRPFVKQGQPVAIAANDGKTIKAKVSYLSPIINPETRTSIAYAAIDNRSGYWLPGTYAYATFLTDKTDVALAVKKEAIQNIDGVDTLFVSTDEGFAVRPVTKGRSDDDRCEIVSGLNPGEEYACKNTFLLKADLKKEEAEHMD